MTAQRSTKEELDYAQYLKKEAGTDCPFCNMNSGHPQFVLETDSLKYCVTAPRIHYGTVKVY